MTLQLCAKCARLLSQVCMLLLFSSFAIIKEQTILVGAMSRNSVNSSSPYRPTFVVNFDIASVICQTTPDQDGLSIFPLSVLCDGKRNCIESPGMDDESFLYCSQKCHFPCGKHGTCLMDAGRSACYCDQGFSGKKCDAPTVNECSQKPCHWLARCTNTFDSHFCTCLPGFEGDGYNCTDIDECTNDDPKYSAKCPANSKCCNIPGTFFCNCTEGFMPKGSPLAACVDIDECADGTAQCPSNTTCVNLPGSYECSLEKCKPGFELRDGKCIEINTCKAHNDCHPRATCANVGASYTCSCVAGFSGSGKTCSPIADCTKNPNVCDKRAACDPNLKACFCQTGYIGDGIICYDNNECAVNPPVCEHNETCLNLEGSYACCSANQTADDCKRESGLVCDKPCGNNAMCALNLCHCKPGFTGDAFTSCTDINECELTPSPCLMEDGAWCLNLEGSYLCCNMNSSTAACQGLSIGIVPDDRNFSTVSLAPTISKNNTSVHNLTTITPSTTDFIPIVSSQSASVDFLTTITAVTSDFIPDVSSQTVRDASPFESSSRASPSSSLLLLSSPGAAADLLGISSFPSTPPLDTSTSSVFHSDGGVQSTSVTDISQSPAAFGDGFILSVFPGSNESTLQSDASTLQARRSSKKTAISGTATPFTSELSSLRISSSTVPSTLNISFSSHNATSSAEETPTGSGLIVGLLTNSSSSIEPKSTVKEITTLVTSTDHSLSQRKLKALYSALNGSSSTGYTISSTEGILNDTGLIVGLFTDSASSSDSKSTIETQTLPGASFSVSSVLTSSTSAAQSTSSVSSSVASRSVPQSILSTSPVVVSSSTKPLFADSTASSISQDGLIVGVFSEHTTLSAVSPSNFGESSTYSVISSTSKPAGTNASSTWSRLSTQQPILSSTSVIHDSTASSTSQEGLIVGVFREPTTPFSASSFRSGDSTSLRTTRSTLQSTLPFTASVSPYKDVDENKTSEFYTSITYPAASSSSSATASSASQDGLIVGVFRESTTPFSASSFHSGDSTSLRTTKSTPQSTLPFTASVSPYKDVDENETSELYTSLTSPAASSFSSDSLMLSTPATTTQMTCSLERTKFCQLRRKKCAIVRGESTCTTCVDGYFLDQRGYCVEDISCLNATDCDVNANCSDLKPFGHTCTCKAGFIGDGHKCDDVDECYIPNTCSQNAECKNTFGSFQCSCRSGFVGNGIKCVAVASNWTSTPSSFASSSPIVGCTFNPFLCDPNAECFRNYCICKRGFTGDGLQCVQSGFNCTFEGHECPAGHVCSADGHCDRIECSKSEANSSSCQANADCVDNKCVCKVGFERHGALCLPILIRTPPFLTTVSIARTYIDNCSDSPEMCDTNAKCIENRCVCGEGFVGNGITCVPDPNDCVIYPNICHRDAVCQARRRCVCKPGFDGDGWNNCYVVAVGLPVTSASTATSTSIHSPTRISPNISENLGTKTPANLLSSPSTTFSSTNKNVTSTSRAVASSTEPIQYSTTAQALHANFTNATTSHAIVFMTVNQTDTPLKSSIYDTSSTLSEKIIESHTTPMTAVTTTMTSTTAKAMQEHMISPTSTTTTSTMTTPQRISPTSTLTTSTTSTTSTTTTPQRISPASTLKTTSMTPTAKATLEQNISPTNKNGTFSVESSTLYFPTETTTTLAPCVGTCDRNARCIDGNCVCSRGFIGDGGWCAINTTDCEVLGILCGTNAVCINHVCVCKDGYVGNGFLCVPINKSSCYDKSGRFACHPKAACVDDKCQCSKGYAGDGLLCSPVVVIISNGSLPSTLQAVAKSTTVLFHTPSVSESTTLPDEFSSSPVSQAITTSLQTVTASELVPTNTKSERQSTNSFTSTILPQESFDVTRHSTSSPTGLSKPTGKSATFLAENPCETDAPPTAEPLSRVVVSNEFETTDKPFFGTATDPFGTGVVISPITRLDASATLGSVTGGRQRISTPTAISASWLKITPELPVSAMSASFEKNCHPNNAAFICHPDAQCLNGRCACKSNFKGDGYDRCQPEEDISSGDCFINPDLCHPDASCFRRRCQCNINFVGNGTFCKTVPSSSHDITLATTKTITTAVTATTTPAAATTATTIKIKTAAARKLSNVDQPCDNDTQQVVIPVQRQNLRTGPNDVQTHCNPEFASLCSKNAECTLNNGKQECVCHNGFSGDGRHCEDINECTMRLSRCLNAASCMNTIGSYTCLCPDGYSGDGINYCSPSSATKEPIDIDCGKDGITLILANRTVFSGKMFVKGQSANPKCSRNYSIADGPNYKFTASFAHCDIKMEDHNTISTVIVIQRHPLFITGGDEAFKLRCTYPAGEITLMSHLNVSMLTPSGTLIHSGENPQCSLSVTSARNGQSVSEAMVGDQLQLTLSVEPKDSYGLIAKNCVAMNMQSDETYKLTDINGCAVDAGVFPQWQQANKSQLIVNFLTFKWPDSAQIRFQCDCAPCLDRCEPVTCSGEATFGRKRRHAKEQYPLGQVYSKVLLVRNIDKLLASDDRDEYDGLPDVQSLKNSAGLREICLNGGSVAATISFSVCLLIIISVALIFVIRRGTSFCHARRRREAKIADKLSPVSSFSNSNSGHLKFTDGKMRNLAETIDETDVQKSQRLRSEFLT